LSPSELCFGGLFYFLNFKNIAIDKNQETITVSVVSERAEAERGTNCCFLGFNGHLQS